MDKEARSNSRRNPPLLVAVSGLRAALFPIPIITIFWKEQIGMSFTDIMLLQSIFGAAVVLLEFPSGYVADRLGYRLSLLVGVSFWTAGWTAYALGTSFAAMVFAEILLGIGFAFTSGADSALLYASLKDDNYISQYTFWEGRVRAAAQISEAASSGIGGWLYSISPRLPFWLQLPVALSGLGLVTATREVHPERTEERIKHLARSWHIVRHALGLQARLRSAMILSVALGISTYVPVWLIQPWMQRRAIPLAWFGPLWAIANVWLAAASLLSGKIAELWGIRVALFICCLLAGISYLGLGLTAAAAGVIFYLGFMTVRGLQGPLLTTVLQADAPAEDRASVLSLNALLFRLAAVVVLPPVGALVDRWGLENVLQLLALLIGITAVPAWALFARAHSKQE
jgi:MFS family permease